MHTRRLLVVGPVFLMVGLLFSGCQPAADFKVAQGIRTAPAHITFENTSDAGLGTIRGYEWEFGDGMMSNEANPSHVYEREGVYTVKLTVYGTGGQHTLVKTAAVVVSDDLPVEAEAGDGACYLVHVAAPWAGQDARRYNIYAAASAVPGQVKVLRSLPEGGYGSRPVGFEEASAPVFPAQLASNE